MSTKLRALILTVIATIILAVAATGFSSAIGQHSRNGNLQITQLTSVVITGDDIRSLPPGENRIVRKGKGGKPTVPTGTVTFFIDGANSSAELVKTGAGTLILPNANANGFGVTKVGPGTLRNTPGGPSLTKELTGTLVLATGDVVYEFRNLTFAELGRISRPGETASFGSNFANTKAQAVEINRLLFGPAKRIAQVEGWKPNGPARNVCSGGSCVCTGTGNCLGLAYSCKSEMTCYGSGSEITCSCKSQ